MLQESPLNKITKSGGESISLYMSDTSHIQVTLPGEHTIEVTEYTPSTHRNNFFMLTAYPYTGKNTVAYKDISGNSIYFLEETEYLSLLDYFDIEGFNIEILYTAGKYTKEEITPYVIGAFFELHDAYLKNRLIRFDDVYRNHLYIYQNAKNNTIIHYIRKFNIFY